MQNWKIKTIAVGLLLIFSLSARADIAVEKVGANSLDFRGQGASPWCFAFAEEQLIKDNACQGQECENNANKWYASIFDIVQLHGQKSYEQFRQNGQTKFYKEYHFVRDWPGLGNSLQHNLDSGHLCLRE